MIVNTINDVNVLHSGMNLLICVSAPVVPPTTGKDSVEKIAL